MIKKVKVLSIFLLFFVAGCWSSYEVNDRVFVTSIMIDQGDHPNEVELTLTTPIPHNMSSESNKSASGQDKPYAYITKKGKTIEEAVSKIEEDMTRKLTWGHSRVVVLGRKYAESGVSSMLEWFTRQPHIRLRHQVYIAPNTIKELLDVSSVYEPSPAEALRQFTLRDETLNTFVIDFFKGLPYNPDTVATLLKIQKVPNSDKTRIGSNGIGMFHEFKMVEKLNISEAMPVAWANSNLKRTKLTFPFESPTDNISLELRSLQSTIRPLVRGSKIVCKIELKGQGRITSSVKAKDLSQPQVIEQLEKVAEDTVKRDLQQALQKSQKRKIDILQLGLRLDWWEPNKWKEIQTDWSEFYPNKVTFDIKPNIEIQNLGYQNPPIPLK